MRHRVVGKRLGRDCSHRRSLLRNLSDALIMHGSIETTLAKAKYLRPHIEKLVTKARDDSSFRSVRQVNKKLISKEASKKLFTEVAPKFVGRPGGYTKITRTRDRDGDKAAMARIEFVA